MCGRVTLTRSDIAEIAAERDAEISSGDGDDGDGRSDGDGVRYRPRYNVAPSDLHWIVERPADSRIPRRVLVPAVWGYVASGRRLINVRGEQVARGAGFREAFQSRRCVVVTDGFYEWSVHKEPVWYHRNDGGLVLLGGLYQPPGTSTDGKPVAGARPRFTILTTPPNRLVSAVHNRMPLVLSPEDLEVWLTAASTGAAKLITPAPDEMLVATPVSKRVNSVRNDDAACLAPADGGSAHPPAVTRQRSLF